MSEPNQQTTQLHNSAQQQLVAKLKKLGSEEIISINDIFEELIADYQVVKNVAQSYENCYTEMQSALLQGDDPFAFLQKSEYQQLFDAAFVATLQKKVAEGTLGQWD